jgi:hypothetical protein
MREEVNVRFAVSVGLPGTALSFDVFFRGDRYNECRKGAGNFYKMCFIVAVALGRL